MLKDFIGLIYPTLCTCCNAHLLEHEQGICTACLCDIPRTNMHLQTNNEIEKKFWGKVPVEKATSFFYFTKGSRFQKILHELKYKENKEIGEILAKHAAIDLLANHYFKDIDIIIPVPLHPKKLYSRGYNQSEEICKGLASVLEKPYNTTLLIRKKDNTTQTKKSVFDRYLNTAGIFSAPNIELLKGKHVLLVDDVLTTGATLEACISVLVDIPDVKVSIFTLAVA